MFHMWSDMLKSRAAGRAHNSQFDHILHNVLSPALFQDIYPKGVIPLAAIQMARPAKDNKFEIVTSQRIFVFRSDNEGGRKDTQMRRSRERRGWRQDALDRRR